MSKQTPNAASQEKRVTPAPTMEQLERAVTQATPEQMRAAMEARDQSLGVLPHPVIFPPNE